jgi:hypothetical protein
VALPNFTTQYVPPGVYWTAAATPIVANPAASSITVAIVGPALGFQTSTTTATLTGTTTVKLAQLGISTNTIKVTNLSGSTTYVATTDYVVTTTASTDGNTLDTTTKIARPSSGSSINSGDTVMVSYQYTDSAYYSPTAVSSFSKIQTLYGPPINPTTAAITSPLSFAAQFAMTNGAQTLILCAVPSVTRTTLTAAYAKLASNESIAIIVPLPVGLMGTSTPTAPGNTINVAEDLGAFLAAQATDNIFSLGIIGYETSVTVAPTHISSSTLSKRVIEAFPNQISYYYGVTNTTQTLAGYYLAAAYAGILASNPVQRGLTKLTIKGFNGIPPLVYQTMTVTYKNQLSAAGVCVTELTGNGSLQVRHGVTTAPTSIYTREISLVRTEDHMVTTILNALDNAGLIGAPITANTTTTINSLVSGLLTSLVSSGVIASYGNVVVEQQSLNPTIVSVQFAYQPSYPLNYITFTFTITTSVGKVSQGSNSGGTVTP